VRVRNAFLVAGRDGSDTTDTAPVGRAAVSTALARYVERPTSTSDASGVLSLNPAATAAQSKQGRPGAVALLVNAALPLLAVLTLLALYLQSRRKKAAPAHIPRHRRKEPLPQPKSARSR
jgi:hypothetical protein